ncbi:MAG: FUSC family protein [Synechococcus sp. BS307-5m-G39]|nr:FUSC family protein [Synechococcus sp. BS307-5m-G39]MBL6800694.1 FUSC family protein [Synechococcus sp. BS307-5m-G37]
MDGNLLRQSLRLGLSILITCAIAQHFQRITYLWYPLLAVITVVDDQDENSLQAARGRMLGTAVGGLVTFLVHTILSGWIGILVSLLITIPVLRRMGWSSGLSTAVVVTVMFLGIDAYTKLNWSYVFNRSLDTLVGIAVALVMGRLLWPKNRLARMQELHQKLETTLHQRLKAHSSALKGEGPTPAAINTESVTKQLLELQRLINVENSLGVGHVHTLKRLRWAQRMSLWRCLQVRWLLVERLIQRVHQDLGTDTLPELSHYLSEHLSQQGARAEALKLELSGSSLPLPQRIALEEQVTRFLRLIRSQQLLERAHQP